MSEAQSALAAVKEYAPKKKEGLFPPRRQVTEEELLRPDTLRAGRRAAGRIHTWLDTLARMDADESRLLAKKNGLTPWLDLNMPMELQESAHVVFRPCVFPSAVDLRACGPSSSAQELPAELIEISQDRAAALCAADLPQVRPGGCDQPAAGERLQCRGLPGTLRTPAEP